MRKKKGSSPIATFIILCVLLIVCYRLDIRQELLLCIAGIGLFTVLSSLYRWIKYRKAHHKMDEMEGEEFEEYLAYLFQKIGYKVETTPKSNDYGADLILYKDGIKIVVQAKRYSDTVGISAVQQVLGARFYYSADEAWVVTNNYYSSQAKNLAQVTDIQLYDREYILSLAENN